MTPYFPVLWSGLQIKLSTKSFGRDAAEVAARGIANIANTLVEADLSDIIAGARLLICHVRQGSEGVRSANALGFSGCQGVALLQASLLYRAWSLEMSSRTG